MSITITRTQTITFTSHEDKNKAFGYMLRANIPFKGVGLDTVIINKSDCDTLKKQGINFS